MSDKTEGAMALARFFQSEETPTKAQLAEECGIPPSSIARILSGDRRPTYEQAAALKKLTAIPVEAWARR